MGRRGAHEKDDLPAIRAAGRSIAPLHEPIAPTKEGDWLDEHDEPGQSFDEYRRSDPVMPVGERTTIYLQPLGDFDPSRAAAIEATARLLEYLLRRADPNARAAGPGLDPSPRPATSSGHGPGAGADEVRPPLAPLPKTRRCRGRPGTHVGRPLAGGGVELRLRTGIAQSGSRCLVAPSSGRP